MSRLRPADKPRDRERAVVLASGTLVLFFLGLLYSWSVFVAPLESEFGWTRNQTSAIYTISVICFQGGILLNGVMVRRISQRASAFLGLAMIASGLCLCALTKSLGWICLFYGVFCGLGIGICHNSWIACILRWFPDKSGLATGIALFGYGTGGLVLGAAASAVIYSPLGWRAAFVLFGICVLAVGLFSMRHYRDAPDDPQRENGESLPGKAGGKPVSVPPKAMLRAGCFWTFYLWKGVLLSLGTAVIGHTAMIASDTGASVGLSVLVVGAMSVGNGCGRILAGAMADKIGVMKTLVVLAGAFTLAALSLFGGYANGFLWLLVAAVVTIGVCYGGTVLLSPNYINNVFGGEHFAMNNGISALGAIPCVFAGAQGISLVKTRTGSYVSFFILMAVMGFLALCAAVLTAALAKKMTEKHAAASRASAR